jgi:hypothetical protein
MVPVNRRIMRLPLFVDEPPPGSDRYRSDALRAYRSLPRNILSEIGPQQ